MPVVDRELDAEGDQPGCQAVSQGAGLREAVEAHPYGVHGGRAAPELCCLATGDASCQPGRPGHRLLDAEGVLAAPKAWFFALLGGWFGWAMAGSVGSGERAAERSKRKSAVDTATQEYERLAGQAKKEAGPEGFNARRAELARMKDELAALPRAEQEELNQLHATAQERQRQKYLDTCFIDRATIPGVGPARKVALRSFGIETAADVTKGQVMQVRGFGEGLTRAVLDWKRSCERQFQFNPAAAVSQADKDAVRAKFAAKRIAFERTLAAAPAELQQFRQRASNRAGSLMPQLQAAAQKLAQAQADYAAV